MRRRIGFALGIVMLFGTVTFAQEYPKVEVGLNYSYVRFNPENSNWTNGGFSLNGGGGDVTYFFTKHFGLKGDFMGTTSQTRTVTVPSNVCSGGRCAVSFQANLFTYNALRHSHYEALCDPTRAVRLYTDPIREWLYQRQPEPEQLPLSGGCQLPVRRRRSSSSTSSPGRLLFR